MHRLMMGLVAALAATGWGLSAQATTLDFNSVTPAGMTCVGTDSHPCYGDNVGSAADTTYGTYTEGNGFTPNVALHFNNSALGNPATPGLGFWGGSSSGTVLGLWASFVTGYVTLTASPGFNVKLNTIDVGTFGTQSTSFDILSGGINGTLLTSLSFNSGNTESLLVGLVAQELTIRWTNWNTGIAGLNFDQVAVATTPIPAALPLFASALGGLGLFGWRRRKTGAPAA
ncbi:MAG TPA: hypothetical protein VHA35_24635 [Dongiaceae bacterium]|jgi:hypothetical protein|nr:hypothetical protein [Dongiaceae bacterium]